MVLVKPALLGVSMQQFQKYCPPSIHCGVDNTVDSHISNTDVNDCCGSCSCDPNCGQTLPCCFVEDNDEYTWQHGQECVEPFIGDRYMVSKIDTRGVMMVTRCFDRNVQCKNTNGQINIWPVEGRSSEIFLNEECAKCNNGKTFTRWDIKLMLTRETFQLDSFRNLGPINSYTEISERTFVFLPLSTSNYKTCEKYSFKYINYASCPNETYKELCSSVILPYFSHKETFRNVFCYLCHVLDTFQCIPFQQRSGFGSYSMLLDSRISTGAVSRYYSRTQIDSKACDANFVPHPYKVLLFVYLVLTQQISHRVLYKINV